MALLVGRMVQTRCLALLRGELFWPSHLPLSVYGSEIELGVAWGQSGAVHRGDETVEGADHNCCKVLYNSAKAMLMLHISGQQLQMSSSICNSGSWRFCQCRRQECVVCGEGKCWILAAPACARILSLLFQSTPPILSLWTYSRSIAGVGSGGSVG